MVMSMKFLNLPLSLFLIDSSALTMVTLLQMSRKVMNAVKLFPSVSEGFDQLVLCAHMIA